MTNKLLLPSSVDRGQGKAVHRIPANLKPTQSLTRFTVLWVNRSGVPFNTTGFTCQARTLNGALIATVRFDSFGTAIFRNIFTPTNRTIVIRTFDRFGVLFRTRTVPARVSAYAIIG